MLALVIHLLLACISPAVYIAVSFNSPSYAEDLLRKTYILITCFVRYGKAAKPAFESVVVCGNAHIECFFTVCITFIRRFLYPGMLLHHANIYSTLVTVLFFYGVIHTILRFEVNKALSYISCCIFASQSICNFVDNIFYRLN